MDANANAVLCVDDTALYYASNSSGESMLTLRIELDALGEWLMASKLTGKAKKTQYIIFFSIVSTIESMERDVFRLPDTPPPPHYSRAVVVATTHL